MMMRKGQVAYEFVTLVAVSFTLLVIFMFVVLERTESIGTENEYNHLIDMARSVQIELYLADSIGDGYSRMIILPERLDNRYNYSIHVTNNTLITASDNYQYTLVVPLIGGDIAKGNNTINKTAGKVMVTND
ncbi:hypothetical protein COV93_01200 [Candidatus Woesearchaeota archaeon CG11_big_fil_rev_8_21_14_0_20_43_8]|nr:MAG: hypothetical protein COV93_01200 [Candidatus Woesearchaeota archaeon CG11_big_fil_rev_8_21_14_0_20_43_8]PIO05627.1 MAG: hypothetical protein COT47_03965 [Candidatus Woesearchaeota archaeon CG08_land_8_20_14_0_20_43_7]